MDQELAGKRVSFLHAQSQVETLSARAVEQTAEIQKLCGGQDLQSALQAAAKDAETQEKLFTMSQGLTEIYAKFRASAAQKQACPLCDTGFHHNQEAASAFNEKTERLITKYSDPAHLAQHRKAATEARDRFNLLQESLAVQSEVDRIQTELVDATRKLRDSQAEITGHEEAARAVSAAIRSLASETQQLQDLREDCQSIQDLTSTIKEVERELELEQSKLFASGACLRHNLGN